MVCIQLLALVIVYAPFYRSFSRWTWVSRLPSVSV